MSLLRHPLLLLLVVLMACSPARRRAGPQANVLRNMHFEGNGGPLSGHNNLQLEQQLETKESAFGLLTFPLTYLVEPKLIDDALLPRDAYRLEVWYAHHGWFDAKVVGWELRRVRDRTETRAGVVDMVGHVDPGPRSLVTEYRIEGMDKPQFRVLSNAMRREAYLRQGDPFDLEYAEHDRALLLELLQAQSYAYARVDLEVRADPARQSVVVVLRAEPGISARFGTISIRGNRKIPKKFIAEVLKFEPGSPYKPQRMQESQRALFGMGTFSLARVDPDLSDPTNPEVPVVVKLTESKWRTFRLGIGSDAALDPDLQTDANAFLSGITFSPRVTGTARHVNLLRQLIRAEAAASLGYTYTLGDNIPTTALKPDYSLRGTLTYPRIFSRALALEIEASAIEGRNLDSLRTRRLALDMTGIVRPTGRSELRLGPHIEEYCFLFDGSALVENTGSCPDTPQEDRKSQRAIEALFGTDFANPYLVTAMDASASYDRWIRNSDAESPIRGWYLAGGTRVALPVVPEKSSTFVGLDGDVRWIVPVAGKERRDYSLRLAFGIQGEILVPYNGGTVPYPEKAFLGGSTSIRGFRSQQVGPYRTACASEDVDPETNEEFCATYFHQPQGGTLATEGTIEVRYPWAYGITWATFVDAGVLAEGPSDVSWDRFRYSAGAGMRYNTIVGPVRFDVSLRPLFLEDQGPVEPIDDVVRPYDFFSSVWPGGTVRPPFAVVYYLAIGDAL